MKPDIPALLATARMGRGQLVRFLMERSSTEDDADDYLALLADTAALEARVGVLEGALETIARMSTDWGAQDCASQALSPPADPVQDLHGLDGPPLAPISGGGEG